jgi:hypothetical protein
MRASLVLPSAPAVPGLLPATEIALAKRPVDLTQSQEPRASQKARGQPWPSPCAARTRDGTISTVIASATTKIRGSSTASSASPAVRPTVAPRAPSASDLCAQLSTSDLPTRRLQYRRHQIGCSATALASVCDAQVPVIIAIRSGPVYSVYWTWRHPMWQCNLLLAIW